MWKSSTKNLTHRSSQWIVANVFLNLQRETRKSRAGRVAQVVEHLSSKSEALTSNSRAEGKKRMRNAVMFLLV
jgi:hypothetical protein